MLDVCAIVDIGLVRTKNDDRILLGKTVYSEGEYYLENIDDNFICAVSDGIGGYSHGDLAAEMTLHEFIDIREFSEETVLEVINISNDKDSFLCPWNHPLFDFFGKFTSLVE